MLREALPAPRSAHPSWSISSVPETELGTEEEGKCAPKAFIVQKEARGDAFTLPASKK